MYPQPTWRGARGQNEDGALLYSTEYENSRNGKTNLEVPCVKCELEQAASATTMIVAECPAVGRRCELMKTVDSSRLERRRLVPKS